MTVNKVQSIPGHPLIIVGGGITGLTIAYEALKHRRHRVTLIEKSQQLGGEVSGFQLGGAWVERFYHHLFKSDHDIISLIREMGLENHLQWTQVPMGYYTAGRLWSFGTPLDLLRFRPIPFAQRITMGFATLRLQKMSRAEGLALDDTPAGEWLSRHCGREAYQTIWQPLLKSKFDENADRVSMSWLWSKFTTRLTSKKGFFEREELGYLLGGFQRLVDRLEREIIKLGGVICTGTSVQHIQPSPEGHLEVATTQKIHLASDVVVTTPLPVFPRLVPSLPGDYATRLQSLKHQHAIVIVLAMDQPLSPYYWTSVGDPHAPFVGMIEHTHLVPSHHYQGLHILYLSRYLDPDHPYCRMAPEGVFEIFLKYLNTIHPLPRDSIKEHHVFRAEGAQPVITTGYRHRLPDFATPIPHLWMVNTAQIYPEDRGTNYNVRLAKEFVHQRLYPKTP